MNSFNREQAEREAKYSRQGRGDYFIFLLYSLLKYLLPKVMATDDLLPQWPLMRVKVAAKIEEIL